MSDYSRDPFFHFSDSRRDAALIARGVNPYNDDTNEFSSGIFLLGIKDPAHYSPRSEPITRPYNLGRVASIVSRSFSPCQRGEHVGVIEYRRRLTELRGAGYPVPSGYSSLPLQEARALFNHLRSVIDSERHAP